MSLLWRCKVMDSGGNVAYSRIVSCKRSTTRWRNVYDLDGLRAKRTNGETTYLYTYLDGQLTHMKVDGQHYYFTYDPNGTPVAMTWNGKNYYYVTNLQGDITHILDNTGAVVTSYVYNAWGKLISTTGSLAGTVGRYNPLRYRGYVYDTETGLYYLRSRYYNPDTGRFINADGMTSTGQGVLGNNMFAYCGNNPIVNSDASGMMYIREAGFGGGCGGGAGGIAIDLSGYGYAGVANYSSSAAVAAGMAISASPFIETTAEIINDLRAEHIAVRRKQTMSLSVSVPKAEALAIPSTKQEIPQYFTAEIVDNIVVPRVPLTYQNAKVWVTSGGNLLAVSRSAAFAIVKFFPSARWDGRHGCEKSGYLNHFHLSSAHGNHIWYLGD